MVTTARHGKVTRRNPIYFPSTRYADTTTITSTWNASLPAWWSRAGKTPRSCSGPAGQVSGDAIVSAVDLKEGEAVLGGGARSGPGGGLLVRAGLQGGVAHQPGQELQNSSTLQYSIGRAVVVPACPCSACPLPRWWRRWRPVPPPPPGRPPAPPHAGEGFALKKGGTIYPYMVFHARRITCKSS